MLQYVTKYMRLYYAIAFAPPIIFIAAVMLTSGPQAILTTTNWLITIGLIVLCSIIGSRLMNRSADHFIEKMVLAYNEDCDPRPILEQGRDIRNRIKVPFNEWGSWFLSGYCLASIDVGDVEEARKIVDMMRESAQRAKTPLVGARICLNMHASVKKLYGEGMASLCLDQAESLLAHEPNKAAAQDCRAFIAWERKVEEAEASGDGQDLVTLYSDIKGQTRQYMRTRVLAAFHEAAAHRTLGDAAREAECLEFVAEHGNMIIEAVWARKRLRELAAPPGLV